MTTKAKRNIERAIAQTGLLFQRHPGIDHWKVTRPGARPGEIVAYVHKPPTGRKSFISVVKHYANETDEDGYEWDNNCFEIIVSHADGGHQRDVIRPAEDGSIDDLTERVAEFMHQISR